MLARLEERQALSKLIGSSPRWLDAIRLLPTIARSGAPVIIGGETGTGKELVARAIHYLSPRAGGPFVGVNCAALPDSLLEDELFGHERGAYTDARERRSGLVEQAERGTLFLDEIDSLTPRAQASLLRLLQERRYRPLGSQKEVTADVRLVTASNVSLDALARDGAWRADLFYRLNVFRVDLPPLRDRSGDILILAEHFAAKHAIEGRGAAPISDAAHDDLLRHTWPGNVRELENCILRATHLTTTGAIEPHDLGLSLPARPLASKGDTFAAGKRHAIAAFERAFLMQILARHAGNISQAALAIGKDRRDLGRLLKKHGLDAGQFRQRRHCR